MCANLLTNHSGKDHHLIADNYYTSIDLAEEMLLKKIYVTGTVRSNCKNLPTKVKKNSTKKGEIIAVQKGQMLALSWVDHKQVRLLSTFAEAATVDVTKTSKCPMLSEHIICWYARSFNVSDQMTDHYGAELGTVKCWRKIVFHLFDRTVSNAYICYKNNINDPTSAKKKITSSVHD